MQRITVLILSLACALLLLACAGSNSNTSTSNSNSSAPSSASSSNSSSSASTASTSGDKIGVPECDDFIAKYEACVSNKVPEVARAQYQASLKQWRESWKKLAENPQTRGTLASACKQAHEQQAAALKSMGCSL